MKKKTPILALPALLIAATAYGAPVGTAVAPFEVDDFIGERLYGEAHAPLGIVGAADTDLGLIQIAGPQGQVATIHASMLVDATNLQAPTLTMSDIASLSNLSTSSVPVVSPEIFVEEPFE